MAQPDRLPPAFPANLLPPLAPRLRRYLPPDLADDLLLHAGSPRLTEAFVHLGTCGYLWDIAAIDALAQSAGGRVTNEHGAPIAYRQRELRRDDGVVLSNGHVHDALLAAIGCDP